MHFLLYLFTEKFTRLLFLLFTQLIPILFFNCSVEEDGEVASAGISGQDEGVWTNQRQYVVPFGRYWRRGGGGSKGVGVTLEVGIHRFPVGGGVMWEEEGAVYG